MQNQEIGLKIEQILQNIKMCKAPQLQSYLQMVTKKGSEIIGNNQIQKIRHSSLLKLFIYELVIFLQQKCSCAQQVKTVRKAKTSLKPEERCTSPRSKLQDIKDLLATLSQSRSTQSQMAIEIKKFKMLQQKFGSLQREIIREMQQKKRFEQSDCSDSEGTELMIDQLQSIIKRKENRIKQLNAQLQQNFNDKQELEEEIYLLELNNTDLSEKVKELEYLLAQSTKKNQQTQAKYVQLLSEFNKYRQKEKDQLLKGVNSFINSPLPDNIHPLPKKQVSPEKMPSSQLIDQPMTNSTRMLFKYCMPSITINNHTEERTIKKPTKIIESESQQQELLLSVKQSKRELGLQNEDHSLQRLLLMQALFIQKALQDSG